MSTRRTFLDFLWINGLTALALCLALFAGSCGFGSGNPSIPLFDAGNEKSPPASEDASGSVWAFDEPVSKYDESEASDCGSFTEASPTGEVEAGRACVRSALSACSAVRYLMNRTNADETRFVSFVSVELTTHDSKPCRLYVHTVSNDAGVFVGNAEASCAKILGSQIPELACGIGG